MPSLEEKLTAWAAAGEVNSVPLISRLAKLLERAPEEIAGEILSRSTDEPSQNCYRSAGTSEVVSQADAA